MDIPSLVLFILSLSAFAVAVAFRRWRDAPVAACIAIAMLIELLGTRYLGARYQDSLLSFAPGFFYLAAGLLIAKQLLDHEDRIPPRRDARQSSRRDRAGPPNSSG